MYSSTFKIIFFCTYSISICVGITPHNSPFLADIPLKKYGDPCETLEYCHGELVSCQQGSCSCSAPEDMIYDDVSQGCRVITGKKCEIASEIWKVNVNCVDGAVCDRGGICICADNYFSNWNKTCSKKRLYKESCTADHECDNTMIKSLVCIDKQCSCDKRGQIYEEKRQACVGTVDSECEMEDEDIECVPNASCRQGRCLCKPNFAKSVSGKCELGFGTECNPSMDSLCADIYFTCINNMCQCKHPIHQVFDERTKECLSLVHGPCTFPKKDFIGKKKNVTGIYDIQKCIKNAHCVDKGFYSECECKPGYVQTKTGGCAPGFGEDCDSDECDPINNLFCINGKCQCLDGLQTFDVNDKKCVGTIGSRCTRETPKCVEFASCVIPESENAGQCICDKYALEISNRTCIYGV